MEKNDSRLKLLKESIAAYPDFPKEGICFQDIFGAMRKSESLMALISLVEDYAKSLVGQVDAVVALDARGFLFGPIIANTLKIPFVPVRKKGKLPGDCLTQSYDLEYGSATIEIQKNAFDYCSKKPTTRVVIVDDLLATGGTLQAACDVVNKLGHCRVTKALVIMELSFLNGRSKLPHDLNLTSFIEY